MLPVRPALGYGSGVSLVFRLLPRAPNIFIVRFMAVGNDFKAGDVGYALIFGHGMCWAKADVDLWYELV
jgi:hypothetical protein